MKRYSPTGRRNYGRPLKRLLDTWDRSGSTSGPTPRQTDDDDDDDDDDDNDNGEDIDDDDLRVRDNLEDPEVEGKVILRWMFSK
jgi:hypothetical protein